MSKILIVDDDEQVRRPLVRQLGRVFGPESILEAEDGPQALEIIDRELPMLVLLDVMMPGMDGYEVCRRLKANPDTVDIPIIFVTARTGVEDELKCLEAGAVDYITKPVQGLVVQARVKTHLALRQARDTIAQQNQEIRKQNEELRQAARLRDDVEQIVRHDLKGPLNAIIGMPGVLINNWRVGTEQERCLRIIEQSGYLLLDMINRSHDLYKMEKGVYQTNSKPVDLLVVLRRVTIELHRLIHSKGLSLIATLNGKPVISEDTFIVAGEELLYHSMLSNLLKNAIEASPAGKCLLVLLDRGEQSVMRITNQGNVPVDIRDRFFDKYVTSGKRQGTGLGTYSAKLIAATLGGDIRLDTTREGETSLVIQFSVP